jgi:hypothetical protein
LSPDGVDSIGMNLEKCTRMNDGLRYPIVVELHLDCLLVCKSQPKHTQSMRGLKEGKRAMLVVTNPA